MNNENNELSGYYAIISGNPNGFIFTVLESDTQNIIYSLSSYNIDYFIENFSNVFNSNYKCIIFDVFKCQNSDHPDNIMLCQQLKVQVEKLKIPFYFIQPEAFVFTSLLTIAKHICKEEDIIFFAYAIPESIRVFAYRREQDGYLNVLRNKISLKETKDKKIFKNAFYDGHTANKVIVYAPACNLNILTRLKKIVAPTKLHIIKNFSIHDPACVAQLCKWRLEPLSNNMYHIKPSSTRRFYASFNSFHDRENEVLIVESGEELPLHRKYVFTRACPLRFLTQARDSLNKIPYREILTDPGGCHRYELNLCIDENNFPTAYLKNEMVPRISDLPSIFDRLMKLRHPVICFFDNSSVICVFNELQGKYEFLESWNGVYGKDIFLNLSPKRPIVEYILPSDITSTITFIELSTFTKSQHHSPLNNGIKISEKSKTEIFLEIDERGGSQKLATPAFFMSLILKEHIMAIKNHTGIQYDKIGIHIFPRLMEDSQEASDRMHDFAQRLFQSIKIKKEIQALFKTSCNLLRIHYSEEVSQSLERIGF